MSKDAWPSMGSKWRIDKKSLICYTYTLSIE
jgi:hypothetical protein